MLALTGPKGIIKGHIKIAGSKSISNRLLILNEVPGLKLEMKNLSCSEDTLLLQKALQQSDGTNKALINVHHSGTCMRFLTAFLANKKGRWTLTGSERMKQRPIGDLVEALRSIGADISYLEKENFPPLIINGNPLDGGSVEIDGGISSQFISALLLVAPFFEKGLDLKVTGEIVSKAYIDMTIDLLRECGLTVKVLGNNISVKKPQKTSVAAFDIESDWSSASYWYSICALSENAEIELEYFHQKSRQGDSILMKIYDTLGVKTTFRKNKLCLTRKERLSNEFSYNFINCPDLAQTVAVTCVGLSIKAKLSGLQTLTLKESDRIKALKSELEKFGASVKTTSDFLKILPGKVNAPLKSVSINTYNDHRMAMSFAPLALKHDQLYIQNPTVVSKSYPRFWEDLQSAGFGLNLRS